MLYSSAPSPPQPESRQQLITAEGRSSATTLVDLLSQAAADLESACRYTFLNDDGTELTWTIQEVEVRARAIAASLQGICRPGDRVLLVYPPCLDFVPAFLGCMYAGVLPVPATYPKPRRPMPRLTSISRDCGASVALTTSGTLETLDLPRTAPELQESQWCATDAIALSEAGRWRRVVPGPGDLAFLQYTSGSTSEPKGVMVTHANLIHNLAMIHRAFSVERLHADGAMATSVWWLPAYHDMGLIGGILGALYSEGRLVMMSPATFLRRPIIWLRAMSEYRATVSGAPNFAYDLCVSKTTPAERAGLDLSYWRLAFCGAEPVRALTLRRFADAFAPCGLRPDVFYPCYGLAEATLLVTGGDGPLAPRVKSVDRERLANHHIADTDACDNRRGQEFVSCGRTWFGQEVAIVDAEHSRLLGEHCVGEIWVRGPSVARGYWNRPAETAADFGAVLPDDLTKHYLRTGDLGFLSDGELFVTGRAKEMVIVRGRNFYPQDIELTVGRSHPALNSGAGAAFSVEMDGEERLVTVFEVDRQYRDSDFQELFRCARRAVVTEHEVDLHAIVLIRQASLPRTTSGKTQRNLCRRQYLAKGLNVVAEWHNGHGRPGLTLPPSAMSPPAATDASDKTAARPMRDLPFTPPDRALTTFEMDRLAEQIESWLLDWLVVRAAVPAAEVDRNRPFAEYGLDSLTAVELSRELEDGLKVSLTPVIAWNYPTPATLAGHLARTVGGVRETPAPLPVAPPSDDFERLLSEVESLSDDDARSELQQGAGDA
jgi:acyl-CoA synthetase (AMP-forming)/AMP-acid ligase II/acyl carrier protein